MGQNSGQALYFFFQAEDGIRDVAVTGVQTCALPISWEHMILIADQGSKCSKFAVGLDGTSRISSSQKSVEKIICGGSPWDRTVTCFSRPDSEVLSRPGLTGPPPSCVPRPLAGMS